MDQRLYLTDDAAIELLESLPMVLKPVHVQRSTEGGDHIVWTVNENFILRVPAHQQTNIESLRREKAVLELIQQSIPYELRKVVPIALYLGTANGGWRYGLYKKVEGISVEHMSQRVTAETEKDLAKFLQALGHLDICAAQEIGVPHSEDVNQQDLSRRALKAWNRIKGNRQLGDLAKLDIQKYMASPLLADGSEAVLSHADLKGEHIFIDPTAGKLTGIIDWGDTQVAQPGIDIGGLAISIGALAAVRVGAMAGISDAAVQRGLRGARCESIVLLDKVMNEGDDSPEWLVRRQLERALEGL
ncbi:hypothetical protein NW759_005898 [Fusarium solani]|nr:hypothetical protein NW759_005898 [Fusarium solani]